MVRKHANWLRRRGIAGFFIVAALGLIAVYYLAPWRTALAGRLEAILAARGLHDVHLSIDAIGWHSAAVKDILIGSGDQAPRFDKLVIGFTPDSLRRNRFTAVTVKGLHLAAHMGEAGFHIAGLPDKPPGSNTAPPALPAADIDLRALPFTTLTLSDSDLRLSGEAWQVMLPFAGVLTTASQAALRMDSEQPKFSAAGLRGQADAIGAVASLQSGKGWTGRWTVKNFFLPSQKDLPHFDGAGSFAMTTDKILVQGVFADADKGWRLAFLLDDYPADTKRSAMTLVSAAVPWMQGFISADGIVYPLAGTKPVRATIKLSRISVDGLLKLMTGKRIAATGTLSGAVPVTLGRDGALLTVDGVLQTAGPGLIQLPPDAIPGNNAQIAVVRTLLGNFHYQSLTITVQKPAGGQLVALLGIEGNNPDVYNGRPVKLNVRLGGDVLALAKANLALLGNPQTLLDQAKQ